MTLWEWILSWFSPPALEDTRPETRFKPGDLVWMFQSPPLSDDPLQPLEESVVLKQFRVRSVAPGYGAHRYMLEAGGLRIQAHESNLFETAAEAVNALPIEYLIS